jgi:hypothetical protein
MKKLLFIVLILVAGSKLFAEPLEWDKSMRQLIRQDCAIYLKSVLGEKTANENEKITSCYAAEIEHQFVDAATYFKLSGRQMDSAMRFVLDKCLTPGSAKKKLPEIPVIETPDSKQMVGHWYDGKMDFFLREDFTVSITFDPQRDPELGTWELAGNELRMTIKSPYGKIKNWTYKMLGFRNNRFFAMSSVNRETHLVFRN